MADISSYLAAIMSAVYGEDVRGSIHDAIEIINDVSEVVLTLGTAVDSPSSSSTGFYDGSLYLNTSTYELWQCVGTDSWTSQGIIKGDPGAAGEDGNRWYRGTNISGKAVNPTVYSSSGITDANPNDFYLNPTEGAVYHCVTGGDASTATWSYDFTMTGGGGGGSVVGWNQIQTSTGATKIAEITIDGSTTDVYAPQGGGGSSTLAGLDDTNISSPTNDQVLKYDSSSSKWINGTAPQGGHTMNPLPSSDPSDSAFISAINTVLASPTGNQNDEVASLYGIGKWSNTYEKTHLIVPDSSHKLGVSGYGDWDDESTYSGWLQLADLKGISATNYEIKIVYKPSTFSGVQPVLRGYKIEDYASDDNKNYGLICIKFANEIDPADQSTGVIGVKVLIDRTETDTIQPPSTT